MPKPHESDPWGFPYIAQTIPACHDEAIRRWNKTVVTPEDKAIAETRRALHNLLSQFLAAPTETNLNELIDEAKSLHEQVKAIAASRAADPRVNQDWR